MSTRCIHTLLTPCSSRCCPEPPGTSPQEGTCLLPPHQWVGESGCWRRGFHTSSLLSCMAPRVQSIKKPPAQQLMGASHVKLVASWKHEVKEQADGAQRASSAGAAPAPPHCLRAAGFPKPGLTASCKQTNDPLLGMGRAASPLRPQGCVCRHLGFHSNNSPNLVKGQLFISSHCQGKGSPARHVLLP